MYTVRKEYTFDAAHRLRDGFKGKCEHIHGHTWRIRIFQKSEYLNEFGFVRDFSDFKPIKIWLDNKLDHAMLVNPRDTDMIKFCQDHKQRHYVCQTNPTSENLCRELFYIIKNELNIPIYRVEIDETCTSLASYEE